MICACRTPVDTVHLNIGDTLKMQWFVLSYRFFGERCSRADSVIASTMDRCQNCGSGAGYCRCCLRIVQTSQKNKVARGGVSRFISGGFADVKTGLFVSSVE